MASVANACSFHWKIENMSQCWWLKKGDRIESPAFIADTAKGTKWSLFLYPIDEEDENYLGLFLNRENDCRGPSEIEIRFQLSFLDKGGSVLMELTSSQRRKFTKDFSFGFPKFQRRERVFFKEREAFLPEDALNVQCTIWTAEEKPVESIHLFATTVIKVKRRSLVWTIDNISTLESISRKKFKDDFTNFDLVISEDVCKNLDIDMISFDGRMKYFSCNTSILNSKGKIVEFKNISPMN